MEAIRPKQFDDSRLRQHVFFEMSAYGEEIAKEFRKTTVGWRKDKPKFKPKLNTRTDRNTIEVTVGTDNPVWNYIDKGVSGHMIYPTKPRISGTAGTYDARTMPGTLRSDPAGGVKVLDGNYFNLNHAFFWTGIELRNFSQQITEEFSTGRRSMQARFQAIIDKHAPTVWK